MKARILSLVLFALFILSGMSSRLFGQHVLPETLNTGSANYTTTVGANYATFTLNRSALVKSLLIVSNGNISISPNVGTTGDLGATVGETRYILIATDVPAGTYTITVNKAASAEGIYIHVSCNGGDDPLPAPTALNTIPVSPSLSYGPDAVGYYAAVNDRKGYRYQYGNQE
ncbi:MAG: hypothetical protein LBN06_12495 [Prevotellaceae bacterium]|jgi:hypothetical protein|nr:hypothetical protein [Prevotellaceae bacterium]